MCRGLGAVQRHFYGLICEASMATPMTFAQMVEKSLAEQGHNIPYSIWVKDYPSIARSFRRAVYSLVIRRLIIELGNGSPGQPYRYCIMPDGAKPEWLSAETRLWCATKAQSLMWEAMIDLQLPDDEHGPTASD